MLAYDAICLVNVAEQMCNGFDIQHFLQKILVSMMHPFIVIQYSIRRLVRYQNIGISRDISYHPLVFA